MSTDNKTNRGEGGYIFLSHSHNDIEIVRRFRNILEDNGFDALCFFLKCLNDDAEVFDLIKREIDSRKQFVFIESENSNNSKWVQREREYVRRCEDKIIHTVPLKDIIISPEAAAADILYSMRVFISYRKRDHSAARAIINELERQDFQIWFDDFLAKYSEETYEQLKAACEYGAVVLVLTENSFSEYNYQMDTIYPCTLKLGGFVIPVWAGDRSWKSVEEDALRRYPKLDAAAVIDGSGDPKTAANQIIEVIKKHSSRYSTKE